MKRIWRGTILGVAVCAGLACEQESAPETEAAAERTGEEAPERGATGAHGEVDPAKSDAKSPGALPREKGAEKCPAGQWHYDYADAALETMAGNLEGAKVTKEEGSLIATIPSGKSGTMKFETEGEKPVVNEISASASGMPMVVSLTMSGKTTSKFEVIGDGKIRIFDTDMSGFTVTGSTTIGGRKIELDAGKTAFAFDAKGGSVEHKFKCEGGNLMLLARVDDVKTSWFTLKPVK